MKNRASKFAFILFILAVLVGGVLSAPNANAAADTPFILAVEKDYPPFLFVENNQAQGIAYDYTVLLAKKLHKELQVSPPMQLQDMLSAVRAGRATLLADITKTPDRDEFLEFSNPYVETTAVVISRKNEITKWGVRDNLGVTVAVGKGYGVVSYLKQKYPGAVLIELPTDADVIRAVALGAADTGALDAGSLSYLLQREPLSNIEVVAETGFTYALAFAVSEADKDAIPAINTAISQITPQERGQIFDRWITNLPRQSSKSLWNTTRVIEVAGGAIVVAGIIVLWVMMLRRKIRETTKEIQDLNILLDKKVQDKVQEFAVLEQKEIQRVEDLNNIKKAVLNILEDVEDEKGKVEQVTARLSLATQSAKIGVWDWDIAKNEVEADAQFYALYQGDEKDFVHAFEGFLSYVHPEDRAQTQQVIQSVMADPKARLDTHFRILWRNGEVHYLRTVANVIRDKTGKPVKMVGVQWDETKEREVDQAKSEFVSLASHQLRTPLTAIKLFSEMLASPDVGNLNKTQQEYLGNVRESTTRMISLVNDLLNVSRLETGRLKITPEPTNVHELITSVIKEVTPWAKAKNCVILVSKPSESVGKVLVDPALMREVIANFLSNAIRYASTEKPKVVVTWEKVGQEYVYSVKDNGIGIPKEVQSRIFQKFFRADNAVKQVADGSGLGLYVVKTIMESSGGRVWFESVAGKGSTFFASIPETGMKEKTGDKGIAH